MGPEFTGQIVPETCAAGMCGYCDLATLAQNIMNFLIFFAVIVGILMIIYAGFLYLTAAGNSGQVSRAHSVFRVAILGLVLTLAAWLIVNLIMVTFLGASFGVWDLPGC